MAQLPVVVPGLVHGAQYTLVHKGLLAGALDPAQNLGEVLGAGFTLLKLSALDPQPVKEVAELIDPVGVGTLVDPVEEGYLRVNRGLGGGAVGGHHQLLDKLLGYALGPGQQVYAHALLV